jgi:hypothetical protein
VRSDFINGFDAACARDSFDFDQSEIPSTSLRAGSSLRLKNGSGQDDGLEGYEIRYALQQDARAITIAQSTSSPENSTWAHAAFAATRLSL